MVGHCGSLRLPRTATLSRAGKPLIWQMWWHPGVPPPPHCLAGPQQKPEQAIPGLLLALADHRRVRMPQIRPVPQKERRNLADDGTAAAARGTQTESCSTRHDRGYDWKQGQGGPQVTRDVGAQNSSACVKGRHGEAGSSNGEEARTVRSGDELAQRGRWAAEVGARSQ
eukprot:jgi/Botrbrau1/15924/Bobra.40_1s0104.1